MNQLQITEQFIHTELYKLCDGEATRQIVSKYSPKARWKPADIFRPIIEACLEHTSIEDVCSTPDNPSADTVHTRCGELDLRQTERLVNEWIRDISSRLQFPKNTYITISIDLHQRPYYGRPNKEWVTGMKLKKGTNYSVTFLVATLTTRTKRCPLAVRLLTKTRTKQKAALINEVLSELGLWLPIKRVLLDRGFCQDDIIQLLEDRGVDWIIAAIRRTETQRAFREIRDCVHTLAKQAGVDVNDKLALGQWARKQGLDVFRVESIRIRKEGTPVLLIATFVRQRTRHRDPRKRWRYGLFLYLTNLRVSARYLVKLYGKRWGIETDLRCINDFQAVTNSILPQLRLILFGLAMFFDALWVVYSIYQNILTELGDILVDQETQFRVKFHYELVCTARWFCRWLRKEILPQLTFQRGDA